MANNLKDYSEAQATKPAPVTTVTTTKSSAQKTAIASMAALAWTALLFHILL